MLRRDLNALATRAALLGAARTAFSASGYHAVRLEEIAAAADATTGAIYHHFRGKEGLLAAVAEGVEQEVMEAINSGTPSTADPWEILNYAIAATLDLCSRPDVARIIFVEAPNVLGADAWREVELRYALGGLRALFGQMARTGTLLPADPELATRVTMAAIREGVQLVTGDRDRVEAVGRALVRMVGGLRYDAATRPEAS